MTVNIQYVRMPSSESLNTILIRNLGKLAQKYQFLIRADVSLKLENAPGGKGKVCEIELSAPGPRLFAKSSNDNFEKASAETITELERQLEKRKEKFSKRGKRI